MLENIIKRDDESNVKSGMNFSFFTSQDSQYRVNSEDVSSEPAKRKRGRPRKVMPDGNEIVQAEDNNVSSTPLNHTQTNETYQDMYGETNTLLRQSICQLDGLNNDIKEQFDSIKNSKTLKRKYDYLSTLSTTSSSIINTKISAIKEMNKVITDCNNLELKRAKDLKLNENEQDDDKMIMDMYNAFISTPVGTYGNGSPLGPNITNITSLEGSPSNIVRTDMNCSDINNGPLSSSQNMMRLEQNPNVKTVVVYDESTGSRFFDVVDMQTMQSVPNAEKPDAMFLEDTMIDVKNGVARNTNLNTSYPVIKMNSGSGVLDQY